MSEEEKPLLENWKDHLPDEIKSDKSLEDFSDIGALAKSFIETKADVGRSIRIPGPDASTDAVDAFNQKLMEAVPGLTKMPGVDDQEGLLSLYDKLGRPKEPSEYGTPEGLPEGEIGKSLSQQLDELKKVAHESGLTKQQFEAQAKAIITNFNQQVESIKGKASDEQDKLKLDWGSALQSKTESILDLAKQTNAPQSVVDGITEKTLDASTMKWLDGLVDAISGEGPQMTFQGQQSQTRITPSEANIQIGEIMDKPEYWDPSSPQQQSLVEKVLDLQKVVESGT